MRKRYIATTLTAFAVVAYLAMDDSDENRPLQVDKQGKAEADYFIENLSAENYNKDGSLSQQIDAARATHYPDTDTTILQEPSIVVHENQAPQWGIRASEGTLRKNQQLNLNGNVLRKSANNSLENCDFVACVDLIFFRRNFKQI